MTRDEFESRYRLLQEVTRAGGATTHHALGPAGAVVMVHFLEEEMAPRVASVLERPEGVPSDRFLEAFEVEGAPVLVTRFIMDFQDLAAWLDTEIAPPSAGPSPDPGGPGGPTAGGAAGPSVPTGQPGSSSPAGAGGAGAGEFTRLFAAQADPAAGASPTPPPEAPASGASGASPTPPSEAPPPGATDASSPPSSEAPPPPPSGGRGGGRDPGEFTALFRARTPEGDPDPGGSGEASGRGAAAEESVPPGGDPAAPDATPSGPPDAGGAGRPTEPPPPRDEQPGEFTRFFEARDPAALSSTPDEAPGGEDDATPGTAGGGVQGGEPTRDAPSEQAPSSPPPPPPGPPSATGEFTRLFEAPPGEPIPPRTPRPRPAPKPPTQPSAPPPTRPSGAEGSRPASRPAARREGRPPEVPRPPRRPPGSGAAETSPPDDVPEPRFGDRAAGGGFGGRPAHREPGELTARFRGASPEPSDGGESGDFAGWSMPGEDEPGSDETVADDYLERLYDRGGPSRTAEPAAGGGGSPPPPPGRPASAGGGGDGGAGGAEGGSRGPSAYTRVISGMSLPGSSRPEPPPPPTSRAPERKDESDAGEGPSALPYLLGIAVVVLLAVGLVVGYLVLTAPESDGATDPDAEPGAETPATGSPGASGSGTSGLLLLPGEHQDELGFRGGEVRG